MKIKDKESLEKKKDELVKVLDQLVESSSEILKPLKNLDGLQIAALTTFGYLMRISMIAGRPVINIDSGSIGHLSKVIDEICPPMGKIDISMDPCLEASIAYASAMAKCEDEGIDESECYDAYGPAGQSIACAMKEIEDLKNQLKDIFKGLEPPKPFPWPEI
jgi:hypothetical protein